MGYGTQLLWAGPPRMLSSRPQPPMPGHAPAWPSQLALLPAQGCGAMLVRSGPAAFSSSFLRAGEQAQCHNRVSQHLEVPAGCLRGSTLGQINSAAEDQAAPLTPTPPPRPRVPRSRRRWAAGAARCKSGQVGRGRARRRRMSASCGITPASSLLQYGHTHCVQAPTKVAFPTLLTWPAGHPSSGT